MDYWIKTVVLAGGLLAGLSAVKSSVVPDCPDCTDNPLDDLLHVDSNFCIMDSQCMQPFQFCNTSNALQPRCQNISSEVLELPEAPGASELAEVTRIPNCMNSSDPDVCYTSKDTIQGILTYVERLSSEFEEYKETNEKTLSKMKEETEERMKHAILEAFPCGMADGWMYSNSTGFCYFLLEKKLYWSQAKEECRSLTPIEETSYLASVHSVEENEFITKMIGKNQHVWLGLTCYVRASYCMDNDYMWTDGSEVNFTNWSKEYGQWNCRYCPVSDSMCLILKSADGNWYTGDCYYGEIYSVCKKKALI